MKQYFLCIYKVIISLAPKLDPGLKHILSIKHKPQWISQPWANIRSLSYLDQSTMTSCIRPFSAFLTIAMYTLSFKIIFVWKSNGCPSLINMGSFYLGTLKPNHPTTITWRWLDMKIWPNFSKYGEATTSFLLYKLIKGLTLITRTHKNEVRSLFIFGKKCKYDFTFKTELMKWFSNIHILLCNVAPNKAKSYSLLGATMIKHLGWEKIQGSWR